MWALALFQNIGPVEILIVVAVILLLFGGRKIPELARSLGRAKGEFKKGASEVEEEREADRLREEARALGIDPAGKSATELKRLIAERSAEAP